LRKAVELSPKENTADVTIFLTRLQLFSARDTAMAESREGGTVELWRHTWRLSVPLLSTPGLEALREAIVTDDPRLQQCGTTTPPPVASVLDWPVEGACAWGYCGWRGDGLKTVGEVQDFFAAVAVETGKRFGEESACRHFTQAFDEWPREVMRANLLPEVELALAERRR
jgi:hypothetical protein